MITQLTIEDTREQRTLDNPLERLRRKYPWPDERPVIQGPIESYGWFGEGTDEVLTRNLSEETRLVVELGSWLGMSTRFIADIAPHATVVAVDTWAGSTEHQNQSRFQSMLPTLYSNFLSLSWSYRDRIVPLRMNSLEGLRTVAEFGLQPDVIFVDAEHSFEAVTSELNQAYKLFPRATLLGDDYDWEGVHEAVDGFAKSSGMEVERVGLRGWKLISRVEAPVNGTVANGAAPHVNGAPSKAPARSQCVVLVPYMSSIDNPCEQGLRGLEAAGVQVRRRPGSSGIDVARNEMFSDALHDGFESIMFIDSDLGFDAADALRMLLRPEPVLSGVYAKKGPREVTSSFAEGVKKVVFGPEAPGLYPLRYAATGFLRVRSEVLRHMIERLKLPLCNTVWGRGVWPFFQPMIVAQGEGKFHYLGEDWAFSQRLSMIGVTPLADTSFRLYHWGPYGFTWEDAGAEHPKYQTYTLNLS
ncbi:MAG: class I SAM-dependent methyltransferase [Isosphaeraceae bacterium]|nr:class I SAM-dependent methyltransferase [Isosphaeraceae bacterium]